MYDDASNKDSVLYDLYAIAKCLKRIHTMNYGSATKLLKQYMRRILKAQITAEALSNDLIMQYADDKYDVGCVISWL